VRGRDLGATLVERGWARDWPRFSCGAYAAQEERARARHSGLWGMQCPSMWEGRNYSPDLCRR
jgi:endonuclease YncB( thermonuclease family)